MASTPLYKSLKSNGNSFYAFPGSSEDISAAYMNSNYKMYFSKYVLINLPKQNTDPGTQSNPIYFDFEGSFRKSANATPPATYNESLIESLRNYVANQEVVIRESRLNNQQYYYDTNALETTTEKIFFKWCKKLGLIDFEPAIPEDEYFSNLADFQSKNSNSDEYFPEYLWKEREVVDWDVIAYKNSDVSAYSTNLQLEFNGETNFKVGDTIRLFNFSNSALVGERPNTSTVEGDQFEILSILPSDSTQGQRITINHVYSSGEGSETTGQAELVYNRLIQYIGEVNGVSNVQEANRSYTEVYAHIPDHTGMTPDILFRTMHDINYKPNMTFPILPSQYQPEIMGAELFNSPIVSTPQNYPGSYYGQFDTLDFTYETSSGDVLRRSGDYFGISGDINNPVVNTFGIDGIGLDFNISHYVKMNIANRQSTNFDQFNAIEVNNTPPNDFEFNAILWYYTVEDSNGVATTNLYGVSFLDNPDNNPVAEEVGLRFPTYKKLVSNGQQDGSSYAFSLNLNFNIINENPQESYNPEAINSLFSMNLFNSAMSRLASTNDSFLNILADQNEIKSDLISLKGLLYSQTELSTINSKIASLENLLRLYSTSQISSSDSISVSNIPGSPPLIRLENIDAGYYRVDYVNSTDLYNVQGIIPMDLSVPTNRNWLVYLSNNDETMLSLGDNLTLSISRDLDYRQTLELYISPSEFSTQNKKLDIYINSDISTTATQLLLLGDIDLPVFYNSEKDSANSAALWKKFDFQIDFDKQINIISGPTLEIAFSENPYIVKNSIKSGDTLYLSNLFVGVDSVYDFSGQYKVSSLNSGATSSYVYLDVSENSSLVSFVNNKLPMTIHGTTASMLSNKPYFTLNKGKKILITRISQTSNVLSERYRIDVQDL
jgi:hypothetical protein